MNTPEISVVMPAYNAEKYIAESIESILNQSFSQWELIIIDDGSTDNTAEIVAKFQSDKRIKLIKQANGGVSSARNAGINAASGNYITFLDADDAYLPENLQAKYEKINTDSGIEFVYSDLYICDSDMKEMHIEKGIPADKIRDSVLTWQSDNIPGLSSNIMLRHSVLKNKNIYFDKNLSNCADRYYKILLVSGCSGAYIPMPLAKYRNTPGSMSKKVFLLEHDELYILDRIKEKNIIPVKKKRNEVFANVYLMLSGSWYKDAGKTGRAIQFAIKAIQINPAIIFRIAKKGFELFFKSKKA
jgi:glycosyltransferase involved in cell wall biosynthesis